MNQILTLNLQNLLPYLNNTNYTDLSIKQEGEIWCKQWGGEWITENNQTITKAYLRGLFRLLAIKQNKEIDDLENFRENLDIETDNQTHRANVIFGKSRQGDFGITIRLKRNNNITLDDFILTKTQKNQLIKSIQNKHNILISGGTGTGKTSFLNSLLQYIPNKNQKIVTIENAREIDLSTFPNNYPLVYNSDKDVYDIYNDCMRSSPDILMLGEIRKENAKMFLNLINSGHDGTMSTIHASTTQGAITTISNYITATHSNETKEGVTTELKNSLNLIIQLQRVQEGIKVKDILKLKDE